MEYRLECGPIQHHITPLRGQANRADETPVLEPDRFPSSAVPHLDLSMAVTVEETQDEKSNLLSHRDPDITDLWIQGARVNGSAALRRQPDGLHYRVHPGGTGGQQRYQHYD